MNLDIPEIKRVLECVRSSVDAGIRVTDGWRILDQLLTPKPAIAQPDDYKAWYEEAMVASNEAGYAGASAADTIRDLSRQLNELGLTK